MQNVIGYKNDLMRFSGALALSIALVAPTAHAAEAEQPVEQAAITPGEIIVTAERRETLASKTPITMSVVTPAVLQAANVNDPSKLGNIVPNLSIDRNDGLQVTLRGISSADRTERGDPSVPILMDGVYIARRQFTDIGFYDVARVEVLRGPQGTLYGRNTTGGVVNIITNKPTQTVSADLNASYGNFNAVQVNGHVNVPVSNDFALRLSGMYDRRDSYQKRDFTSPFSANPQRNNYAFRLQGLYTPSSALSILVRADYAHLGGNPTEGLGLGNLYGATKPYGSEPGAFIAYEKDGLSADEIRTSHVPYTLQGRSSNRLYGIESEIKLDLGPVAITYLPSYKVFDTDLAEDALFGTVNFGRKDNGHGTQNSQELRFSTTGDGPLQVQAGAMYFLERSDFRLCLLGIAGPYLCYNRPLTRTESWGVFSQATYKITPEFRLTAGVRYSHDHKSLTDGSTSFQQGPEFDPATDAAFGVNGNKSWSRTTWRVGADYDIVPGTMIYASVSTGYKAGSFNDGVVGVTPEDQFYYKPEQLTAYEMGVKAKLAGGRLRLNAAGYYYDYKDQQLSFIGTFNGVPAGLTTNAGASRIKGVEFDGTFAPSQNHMFDFSLAYLDAKFQQYEPLGTGNAPSLKGYPLDRSPKWTASAGYTLTLPLENGSKIEAGIRTRYSSAYTILVPQAPVTFYRQGGFTKTGANLTWRAPENRFYVQGYITNIENRITLVSANGIGAMNIAEPRSYGVRIGVKY